MSSKDSEILRHPQNGERPIRHALIEDLPALATLLARNLNNDPVTEWMFPNKDSRHKTLVKDFTRLIKPHIKAGLVRTISCKSVAVWTPPNPPKQTIAERYRESLYMRWTYGKRVHKVRNCLQRMAARHPRSPHWYLLSLATDDDCRGQGMASRLLDDMLSRCDKDGQQVALETATNSNLEFYQKFGFVVADEPIIDEGVISWLMVR